MPSALQEYPFGSRLEPAEAAIAHLLKHSVSGSPSFQLADPQPQGLDENIFKAYDKIRPNSFSSSVEPSASE